MFERREEKEKEGLKVTTHLTHKKQAKEDKEKSKGNPRPAPRSCEEEKPKKRDPKRRSGSRNSSKWRPELHHEN